MTPPPPFRFEKSLDSSMANPSTAIVEILKFCGGKNEVVG